MDITDVSAEQGKLHMLVAIYGPEFAFAKLHETGAEVISRESSCRTLSGRALIRC
jgi:hypothetical protein